MRDPDYSMEEMEDDERAIDWEIDYSEVLKVKEKKTKKIF
jgi:hypothetical protein